MFDWFLGPEKKQFLLPLLLMWTANYNLVSFNYLFAHNVACWEPGWGRKYNVKTFLMPLLRLYVTRCICGRVTEGASLSVCLVRRQMKVTQHFSDSRWEMETDFSWDSKHCELLTGNDTQTDTERRNTHSAVISVDTPGCKALGSEHVTGAHTYIRTCLYTDATHMQALANTQHVQADKANTDKNMQKQIYIHTYLHIEQNRWTVTILHICTSHKRMSSHALKHTPTYMQTLMHMCTNTDETYTQSTAESHPMTTSLVCQNSFTLSQLALDWSVLTDTQTHKHRVETYNMYCDT